MSKEPASSSNCPHLLPAGAVALIALLLLVSGRDETWTGYLSLVLVLLLDLYLIVILIAAALKSDRDANGKQPVVKAEEKCPDIKYCLTNKLTLPSRSWSLVQVFLLLVIVVVGFANMYYRMDYAVVRTSAQFCTSAQPPKDKKIEECAKQADPRFDTPPQPLSDKWDAIYFSMVTLTTLGYGDFAPARPLARALVVWELLTGMLLLVGIFPLLIARLSTFGTQGAISVTIYGKDGKPISLEAGEYTLSVAVKKKEE